MSKKLSKSVLQMKFMKRTREKVEQEEEEEQGRAMYSSEITEKMLHGNSNIFIEPSYVICEGLIECGRFSFGGMDKDIERLMELEAQAKLALKEEDTREKQKEMTKDVNDEDMIKYYNSLMDTVGNKFNKHKRRRGNNGERFMKPNTSNERL
ncbi:M-phase phosphoprotein 6 [Culicoides brevitarsis]|uniref:M-phase phosphoprotein 6 n=1 Tax=Culicoides brevitarsis TaxID=469753 RepID=UPI00307BBFD6